MAWNESGNGKDPWKRGNNEPNDLDKIVQSWQRRLTSLLGGGGGGGRRARGGGGGGYLLVILGLAAWFASGFYIVDEAERGVVQRFGKFVPEPTLPGLRWHWPWPIESVDLVNTILVTDYAYSTEMLTADEQYVFIDMVIQYRRENAVDFSFEVVEPELTLQDVTESALREVVGTSNLDTLVAAGRREEIASRTQEALQNTLDSYKAGIKVTSVSLKDVKYPQNVQAAVDDAQKARNDADRYILEADRYARDVVPKARGEAEQIREAARAYRDQVIANAEGEASRFEALLTEYKKAPRVTRDRLYIEAVEEVYRNSNKVILDSDGAGNLLYLPIDKLMENARGSGMLGDRNRPEDPQPAASATNPRPSTDPRERRTR